MSSMNFENPVNAQAREMMHKMFGEPAVEGATSMLYDKVNELTAKIGGDIARAAGQPMTMEIHKIGDIKKMSSGSEYIFTETGWRIHLPDSAPAQGKEGAA